MAVKKRLPTTIMHMHACKCVRICIFAKITVSVTIRITISTKNIEGQVFRIEGKHAMADPLIIVAGNFTYPGGVIDV